MGITSQAIFMWTFCIAILLFWHVGVNPADSNQLNFYSSNYTSIDMNGAPTLIEILTNPSNLASGTFFTILIAFIVGLVAVGITSAILRVTTTDAVTFSGFHLAYYAFAIIPIGMIYSFLQSELSGYICGSADVCLWSLIFSILITGTMAFEWVTTCTKFLRTGFDN